MARRWLLLSVAAMTLVACDYSEYERGFPISDRALRDVGALDLAAVSTTQPTTQSAAATTAPTTMPAPAPLAEIKLTIEECRQLALANNLDLRVELFNPTIARESINQERARFESVFTASSVYSLTDQATASELEGSQSKNWSSQVGVRVPLRTGGRVDLAL